METGRTKLSAIVADEKFNSRKVYDEKTIESLAKDIQKNGQLNPLILVLHPSKPGKYFLISGFRRYKAFQLIEEQTKEEPDVFFQLTDYADKLDQYLLNLGENIQREDLTPYDVAVRVTEIADEFELKGPAIASRVGLSTDYVNNLNRIVRNVKASILELWQEKHEKASVTFLTKLAALKDPDEQQSRWDEACGLVPEGEDEGEDEGGTGKGSKDDGEKKNRRPSETVLMSAIAAAKKADMSDEARKAMLQALRFAAGTIKTIPGVFNPADKKRAANGEVEANA